MSTPYNPSTSDTGGDSDDEEEEHSYDDGSDGNDEENERPSAERIIVEWLGRHGEDEDDEESNTLEHLDDDESVHADHYLRGVAPRRKKGNTGGKDD